MGTLGGLIAATQVFYLPVFIAVYQFQPSLLPLTIGLLGGAHFLPYAWLYNNHGYLFVALATGLSALILGGPFMASSLTFVPLAIALTYALGTLWILRENRKQWRRPAISGTPALTSGSVGRACELGML